MRFKEKLQKSLKYKINPQLLDKLPSSYAVIGDIAIFHRIDERLLEHKEKIGNILIEIDPRVKSVIEQIETRTEFRRPQIRHIAGEKKTTTVHKEFNTKFKIDLDTITFSPGNKGERGHLIEITKENEVICDMFACVGNLSLPIIVNNPSVIIYGIEINKEAYGFLMKNIALNKVEERYHSILGDNRIVTPKNVATRVIMGFFDIDKKQFENALEAIKQEGWIHYHYTASRGFRYQIEESVLEISKQMNCKIEEINTRRIKKFSPRLEHMCADIKIRK
ncbi:MAG: class I SAM-dependent methyltransferase [Candidatus Heimdallarchaeaceae archaeon]|jgi:tRNA G37 N-methylase Trm5